MTGRANQKCSDDDGGDFDDDNADGGGVGDIDEDIGLAVVCFCVCHYQGKLSNTDPGGGCGGEMQGKKLFETAMSPELRDQAT